jgi:hypothetical protein
VTPDPPARKGQLPPEPVLPRLLVLEIGARPEKRRLARGLPLVLVAMLLGLLVGVGALAVVGVQYATRPRPVPPPIPSARVAPGTPTEIPDVLPEEPLPEEPVPEEIVPAEPDDPVEVPKVPPPKPAPRPRLPAKPVPAAPGTPGRLVVEGEAVVELQGELGGFRVGTPLPPGDYAVWADFGEGLADTRIRATAAPGRALTVVCVVEHQLCAIVP